MGRRIRLHTILFIFISLIVIILITVLGRVSLTLFRTKTLESFADSRQDTLLQISQSVGSYCDRIELLSDEYISNQYIIDQASLPADLVDTESFREEIERIKDSIDRSFFFPEITYELQLLFDNGLSYASDERHLETLLGLPDTLWFYRARRQEVHSLWQSNILYVHEGEKTNMVSLVRWIGDEQTGSRGAILINLNERQLYEIYSQIIGFQSTIYLISENGQIVSHPMLSMVGRFFYDMKIFNAFFAQQEWAQITKSGSEYLFSRFISPGDTPWIVVEEIPMDVITDPLEHISDMIEVLTVILLMVSLVFIIIFSQRVSRPFESLSGSMEEAGAGDLSVTFPLQGTYESYAMAQSAQQFIKRIEGLIEELKHTEELKRISELEFLQLQINPHFMYNTLFTIRCMVDIGKRQEACEMLDRFSSMLKKILRLDSPMMSIGENIDFLEDYSFIMGQRYGSLSLEYELEEGLTGQLILKFILQPLVENSIYHGFSQEMPERPKITIRFERSTAKTLEIHVRDNGCGMSEAMIDSILQESPSQKQEHIGLQNVRQKLHLYYEGKALMRITSIEGEGTDVMIRLPMIGERT